MKNKITSLLGIPLVVGSVLAASVGAQAADIKMPVDPPNPLEDFFTGFGTVNAKINIGVSTEINFLEAIPDDDDSDDNRGVITASSGAFMDFGPETEVFLQDLELYPPAPEGGFTYTFGEDACALGTGPGDPCDNADPFALLDPDGDLGIMEGEDFFTAMTITGPNFIPLGGDPDAGTTVTYGLNGMWTSGTGDIYNGIMLFSADFPGQTPEELQEIAATPEGIQTAFSFRTTASKKAPEPSTVLGLLVIGGSSLLLRKRG